MNARIVRLLLGISIALAFVVILLLLSRPTVTTAQGAMGYIVVNTTADEYDVAYNGTCSLREAIQTANDGLNFGGCVRVVTSAPLDTILLPAGTYTLTRAGDPEDLNVTGDLDVRGSVIISATGITPPVVTEDSNLKDRLFDIVTGTVTINGLTLTGGSESSQNGGGVRVASGAGLLLNQANLADNVAGSGGGVYSFGTLTVTQSTFTHNRAVLNDGGGLWATGDTYVEGSTFYSNTATSGYAGGLYNQGSLSVTNSIIDENLAGLGGGGIQTYLGTTALLNVTVINNKASLGGSLLNTQGTLMVVNSTVSGNAAYDGGGIFNGGMAMLSNSTIRGNRTAHTGGGIYNYFSDTMTLMNVTVSGNSSNYGGGIFNYGQATLVNVTLSGNAATSGGGIYNTTGNSVMLKNTIVANSPNGGNCGAAALTNDNSDKYSLSSDNTCALEGVGSKNNIDPLLTALGNYGGPTPVHMLKLGSPAIDGVAGNDAPSTDQRGLPRPQGGGYDIGAVERQPGDSDLAPREYLPLIQR